MRNRTLIEKCIFCTSVLGLGLSVAGTKACQEDYNVAAQLQATPESSATPTESATATDDGDDTVTATPTGSPTATVSGSVTASATPTVTPTGSATTSIASGSVNPLVSSLAALANTAAAETPAPVTIVNNPAKGSANGNWLGRAFADQDAGGEEERDAIDTDNDGFSDWVEDKFGGDAELSTSVPSIPLTTDLTSRMVVSNPGYDVEGLMREMREGIDPSLHDSDIDGLPDDYEIAVASDPLDGDSDGDGILDGREVILGADPTKPEWQ